MHRKLTAAAMLFAAYAMSGGFAAQNAIAQNAIAQDAIAQDAIAKDAIANSDDADHAALKELVAQYEAAIEKKDPSLLKPHLAPGFTGVMVTGEEVNDFASLEAYWDRIQGMLGETGSYRVNVNVPEPATIVGDFAYAHGTTDDIATTAGGAEYQFQGFWTAICTRQDGQWKIVRVHGSMDAVTNTFVQATLVAMTRTAGWLGGAIGLGIGIFAMLILGRRRSKNTAAQ